MATKPVTIEQQKAKYAARCQELGLEQRQLEADAGIADAAHKARFDSFHPTVPDASLYSDESLQQHERDLQAESRQINEKIRRLYFGVADPESRKRLMELENEIDNQARWIVLAERDLAYQELAAAKLTGRTWPKVMMLLGPLFVVVGSIVYSSEPAAGAIAGAACAFFFGKMLEQSGRRSRSCAIKRAAAACREQDEYWNIARNRLHRFSSDEILTGRPDDPHLAAVR